MFHAMATCVDARLALAFALNFGPPVLWWGGGGHEFLESY